MKQALFFILFIALLNGISAQTKEVPYTLDDRDRLIKVEAQVSSLRNEMDSRFEAVDTRFDAINERIDTLYWGFGILIALMLFLMGYIMWDRKTALNPVQTKAILNTEKIYKLEQALKEHAKTDSKLAEILKSAGIL